MEAGSAHGNHPLLQGPPNLKRRKRVNRILEVLAWISALIAVGLLALVIGSVVVKGASAISIDFLTESTVAFGPGGGIANALVGTAVLVFVATLIAVPIGILVALYVAEFASPGPKFAVSYVLDLLNGVPTIITGLFVFGLLVAGHSPSGWAGAVALAIVMLPLVARSSIEVLSLVPGSVKEAGFALGVSRWRTVVSVILPTAFGGILTGALLAVARAAGETAPLLFLNFLPTTSVSLDPSGNLSSIPVTIFTFSESPDPSKHAQAWGAALILILFVLILSSIARVFSGRAKRRLEGAR